MTALKLFSIAANGTPMGVFKAVDEYAAVLDCAQDAGFRDIADWRAELDVEDLQETYELILDDIRDLSASESDHSEKMLNIRREELATVYQQLVDGGHTIDYSADIDAALAGSFYRDTVYQETAMVLSVSDIAGLGLLAAA